MNISDIINEFDYYQEQGMIINVDILENKMTINDPLVRLDITVNADDSVLVEERDNDDLILASETFYMVSAKDVREKIELDILGLDYGPTI